jgi:hypothetical protein
LKISNLLRRNIALDVMPTTNFLVSNSISIPIRYLKF